MSLALRDTPYVAEHQESSARRMERGKMPKTLPGLVHWYTVLISDELPERLHKAETWHDADGGSHLGSLAYAGGFRLILEASASITDPDGYYLFPVRAALSRLHRRRPLMARFLFQLGMCDGDWRSVATALGYPLEIVEVYAEEALRRLWMDTYDRTTAAV